MKDNDFLVDFRFWVGQRLKKKNSNQRFFEHIDWTKSELFWMKYENMSFMWFFQILWFYKKKKNHFLFKLSPMNRKSIESFTWKWNAVHWSCLFFILQQKGYNFEKKVVQNKNNSSLLNLNMKMWQTEDLLW